HRRGIEAAALQMTVVLGDQDDRAARFFIVDVDAGLVERRAKFRDVVLAAHVEAAFAAREPAADVLDGGGELLFRRAVERADVIALLIDHTRCVAHGRRLYGIPNCWADRYHPKM